eukprot:CAMPEP_0175816836 /NCGR_PEP_ID=MMETSP0107_2-20121207/6700_1 /TAXON_ID=195067 ORGANISM="Goniomonas pacifica, Strain CCMP1869" /NCGR_SAMPLE_ID=MMETSP0107_2 /ASSEMBLY_ACC=CAM_ASM_000203 /LENGTH=39 /DNA_ID= /DNA_START= /DNA_END= /DNA_ORIENTATION=
MTQAPRPQRVPSLPPKGLAKGLFLAKFDVEGRVAGFHGG